MDTLLEGLMSFGIAAFLVSGGIAFVIYYFIWRRRKAIPLGTGLFCTGGVPLAIGVGCTAFSYDLSHLLGGNSENSGLPIMLAIIAFYVAYWIAVLIIGIVRNSKGISLYFLIFWSPGIGSLILELLNRNGVGRVFTLQFSPMQDLTDDLIYDLAYSSDYGYIGNSYVFGSILEIGIIWTIPVMMAVAGFIAHLFVRRQSSALAHTSPHPHLTNEGMSNYEKPPSQ
jgi:hypothetical protein